MTIMPKRGTGEFVNPEVADSARIDPEKQMPGKTWSKDHSSHLAARGIGRTDGHTRDYESGHQRPRGSIRPGAVNAWVPHG